MNNRQKANKIIDLLVNDIRDRKEIGDEFEQIDEDVKAELISQWRDLILIVLDR